MLRQRRNQREENISFPSPLEELASLLQKLESIIGETREAFIESLKPPVEEEPTKRRVGLLRKNRKKTIEGAVSDSPSLRKSTKEPSKKENDARFIPMPNVDVLRLVEIIRRVSEIVVFADRAAAAEDEASEIQKNIDIFDLFFELNGLERITEVLTGASFDLQGVDIDGHDYMLLPPLQIATQAIQSISILVQNVKRATSLFFLLSNNHINELIKFPLEEYHIAERNKHNQQSNGMSPRRFASSELSELNTHFVTLLKSLALRMNAETLQFFLTYPHATDTEEMMEVDMKAMNVEFPLYERALEFCSAHQDSFIRTTAMNICLNTLRLATVRSEGDDRSSNSLLAPDGVLHNAKGLPIRERLAIAKYVSAPPRVELLISPIFTKLAQLWGALEEQYRDIDAISGLDTLFKYDLDAQGEGGENRRNALRSEIIGKREKATDSFNDAAYNIQDELLLLEDVLRVGLTTLNEQTIEMAFATLFYPLLLQPLLLCFQRSTIPDEVMFSDPIREFHSTGERRDSRLNVRVNATTSAHTKAALVLISSVFQFITNQPLLRLLFTALFHPWSPEASAHSTTHSHAEVGYVDECGNMAVKLDPVDKDGKMITKSDRSTYPFGKGAEDSTPPESLRDTCIFVLSPALAEILEYNGEDNDLIARTRNNPYRKAIIQFLTLSNQVSDLQPLAVVAVDSAFSIFDGTFLDTILFATDFTELHGDLLEQILLSFQSCLVKAVPGDDGTWKIEYDEVAAHALLCAIESNSDAQAKAEAGLYRRYREAALFLTTLPQSLERLGDDRRSMSDPSDKDLYRNIILDTMFRKNIPSREQTRDHLRWLKSTNGGFDSTKSFVAVSCPSSFKILCNRSCTFLQIDSEGFDAAMKDAEESAKAWTNFDAFYALLHTISSTDRLSIQQASNGGVVITPGGEMISTNNPNVTFASLSESFGRALFGEDTSSESYIDSNPGSVLSLAGQAAFPCVCEVLPSFAPLFSAESTKTVSKGITWQSLYLVILGQTLVLAEPERSIRGSGRIVMRCLLEDLELKKDNEDLSGATNARKLIVSHVGSNETPPGLFLYEKGRVLRTDGPFVHCQKWYSTLDIWFEDRRAMELAFDVVDQTITAAKAGRGELISKFLLQDDSYKII